MQVKVKDLQYAAEAEEVDKAKRLAAMENRKFVEIQMQEKMKRDYLDNIFMTKQEKEFMQPLLKQAFDVVKEPKMLSVNW